MRNEKKKNIPPIYCKYRTNKFCECRCEGMVGKMQGENTRGRTPVHRKKKNE